MADRSSAKLYTPSLLALATQLADYPLDRDFDFYAEERSRTCGSTIEIGVNLDDAGRVANLGMKVSACAVGQSSAAIMATCARGRPPSAFIEMTRSLSAWLSAENEEEARIPDWPNIEALKPAWEHKGRHGAVLLAWTAITRALSSEEASR